MANWFDTLSRWFSGYIQPSEKYKKHVIVNKTMVSPILRESLEIGKFKTALRSAEGHGQQRRDLYNLYDNILLDELVMEGIKRRRRAVCKDLTMMHEGVELEQVEHLTRKSFFAECLRHVVDSRIFGHSLLDLDWNVNGDGTTALVNRKHVKPRYGIVTQKAYDITGYLYRKPPFNKSVIEAGGDEDLGDLLQCCIPAILRRMNYSDWAEFAEVMGIPTRVGKYNNEETRQILEEALSNLGAAGHIVMPTDAEIEINNPTNVGQNSGIFEALHRACSNSISIALLGNSMTTQEAETGGYAQGKVQQEGEYDVLEDDRTYVLQWLNEKLTPYLRRIGFDIPEGAEWVYEQEERLSKKDKLAILETLNRNGIPVGMTTWYETAGVPMPGADDLPPSKEDEEDDDE